MQSSNRVISKFALHVHVRQTLPACMRNIFKAILLVSLTTETACWVNKNIGDVISKYTEAMYLLSKHQGMSNYLCTIRATLNWLGYGSSHQVPQEKECWLLKIARATVFFFSALEFGPLPNLDWSQPQMRSESLIWLCWCCLAHDKIAFGYPITTYGNRAYPPQIINFHCIFHDIKHPFMETPILQPSCRDISDNVQTHGVPWDADQLPSSWSNSFSTYLSEFWREFQSDWIPIG